MKTRVRVPGVRKRRGLTAVISNGISNILLTPDIPRWRLFAPRAQQMKSSTKHVSTWAQLTKRDRIQPQTQSAMLQIPPSVSRRPGGATLKLYMTSQNLRYSEYHIVYVQDLETGGRSLKVHSILRQIRLVINTFDEGPLAIVQRAVDFSNANNQVLSL